MRITAQHATPALIAKFGKVVNPPSGMPTSERAEYKFWSNISSYTIQGETEVGICTVYRQAISEVSVVERHMHSPELLIPIDAPFILPLMEEEGAADHVHAFQVNQGEAVIINDAVWHGPCLPVGKDEASYFVIFRKGTPSDDVMKKTITPVEIEQ